MLSLEVGRSPFSLASRIPAALPPQSRPGGVREFRVLGFKVVCV